MLLNQRVVVVLPAYNAAQTLEQTLSEIPLDIVDDVILVDDASNDETADLARQLGIAHVVQHPKNRGYGGNQKTCYARALELNADVVIMLHPDYQYTPRLITAMASMIASGVYQVVLASRILGKGAIDGGMPRYKYLANRVLTLIQNLLINQKLSEYHTGYRGFAAEVLADTPLDRNSDDFIFDNEVISQMAYRGYRIGEISCPTRYFEQASSISFWPSVRYGLGVLRVSGQHFLQRLNLARYSRYE
ncbi:MAG: glycosyltransferase family 2 protein [Lysobacterales bacterium]